MKAHQEGYIPFRGHRTYYKIAGAPSTHHPLLVLHGGPGSSHNYMLGFSKLAQDRQVIFYDQLGGGLSDHPKDVKWSVDLFVEELKTVRDHLKLPKLHLLGHSWGGMLALEYLQTKPKGLQSLTLASSMVSMPLYISEVEKLKRDLPAITYKALHHHEQAGTTDSDAYRKAMKRYNKRHIYRRRAFPQKYTMPKDTFGKEPYQQLWGASEAFPNGSLTSWDMTAFLETISLPTLVIAGQYDELTPQQAVRTHLAIPRSELHILTVASHLAHIEREDEYMAIVDGFLHRAE